MTEIKFRAYDRIKKEYVVLESDMWCIEDDLRTHVGEQYVVQQYTGFQDIAGQDIYVGDILRDKNGELWSVIEQWGTFCVAEGDANLLFDIVDNYGVTVIGNTPNDEHILKVPNDTAS